MLARSATWAGAGVGRAREISLRLPAWAVGALIPALVAGALGVFRIGDKSFWLDESFAVAVARLPTLELPVYLWRNEMHAAPYYVALHVWTALFGDGEAQARLLSVVFGVVAVLATYAAGRRFGVGGRAALVLAVSPMFVEFEQEARVYTLLAAWSAISTLAYLRLVERPTRLRAAAYVLSGAAMIYVHPLGAFVIAAHALATVLRGADDSRRLLLLVNVPIALAWLPMLRFMLLHRDKIAWIPPLSADTVSQHLVALGGGPLVVGALAVLLALGLRRDVLTLWVIVPIAGTLLLSALVQPALQGKYLIGVLPAVAIVVARNRPRALAVLVLLSLAATATWYAAGTKDDWRSAVAWVEERAQPGDGIIFAPNFTRPAFEYYGEVGEPLFPSVEWDERYLPGLPLPIAIPPDVDNPRIWLLESHGRGAPPEVWAALEAYTPTETAHFGSNGPWISLMVRAGER